MQEKKRKSNKPKFIRTKKPRLDKDLHIILAEVKTLFFFDKIIFIPILQFQQKLKLIKYSQSKAERKVKFKDPKTKKESSKFEIVICFLLQNVYFKWI